MSDQLGPETLREWAKNHPHLFEDEEEFLVAHAAAWEADLAVIANYEGDDSPMAQLEYENRTLRKRLEETERNHIERKHIDATPNEGYPLRIMRAYRADCDMRWAVTSDGDVGNPLTVTLNELQDRRAAILDGAIALLVSLPPSESGT